MMSDVDGDHRTHFGASVAFEWRDSEFFFERFRERGPQFLRAYQQVANAPELFARAFAQIAEAKGGSGEKQCGMMLACEFADGFGVGGIRMKHRFKTVEQ